MARAILRGWGVDAEAVDNMFRSLDNAKRKLH
jgi:hypothetical protein